MSEKRDRLARWLTGCGIEIGALHRPLEIRGSAQVTYVDHLPVDQLREHYPELADEPLTPVTVIGSAEDLSAFADSSLDFVIANHLLEHLEYPAQGLLEFQRVLKPGGVLYLALPDQRMTFDRGRKLTSVTHLVEEHQRHSAPANRRLHYVDWTEHVGRKMSRAEAEQEADALMARGYSIHFHVWRPDTFADFLSAARTQLGVELQLLQFAAAEGPGDAEFIMLLGKPGPNDPILPPAAATQESPTSPPAAGPGRRFRRLVGRSLLGPPLRAVRQRLVGTRPRNGPPIQPDE